MAKPGIKYYAQAALMAGFLAAPALAQDIAPSACDPNYYKSLESRAWLEAQREITQNQNLIYKPDSVLAYTCFDQFARVTANMQSWKGFSETDRWGAVISPLSTAMDTALTGLVGPSLFSYLNMNFNNPYLGGRGDTPYMPSQSISGGSYNCQEMNNIWQSAKCYNFQSLPQDGFFTFEEHKAGDKRLLPAACPNPTGEWDLHIKDAGLQPNTAPAWPFDKVEVYYDKLDPAQCDSSTPIPTGVKVKNTAPGANPAEWDEKICIIPGCYFKPGGTCTKTGS